METLSFESILRAMKDDFAARHPAFDAWLESDPAIKLMEAAAYRELLIRQRVNDAARSVMPAFAAGADLDHFAAFYGVERQALDPGDPDALPADTADPRGGRRSASPRANGPGGHDDGGRRRKLRLQRPVRRRNARDHRRRLAGTGQIVVTHVFDPNGFSAKVKDATATSPAPRQRRRDGSGQGWKRRARPGDPRRGSDASFRRSRQAVGRSPDGARGRHRRLSGRGRALSLRRSGRRGGQGQGAFGDTPPINVLGGAVARSGIDAALHVPGARKVESVGWRDIETDEAHAPIASASTCAWPKPAPPRAEETP